MEINQNQIATMMDNAALPLMICWNGTALSSAIDCETVDHWGNTVGYNSALPT